MKNIKLFLFIGLLFIIPDIFALTEIISPIPGQNFTFGTFDIVVNTTLLEPTLIDCWLNKNNEQIIPIVSDRSILINGTKTFDLTVDTSNIPPNNAPLEFYTLSCMLNKLSEDVFSVNGITIINLVYLGSTKENIILMDKPLPSAVTTRITVNNPINVDCSLKNNCNPLYKQAVRKFSGTIFI